MIHAMIFDLDMCVLDTRTVRSGVLQPVVAVLRESTLSPAIQAEIEELFPTTSLEDIIARFPIPTETADAMRNVYRKMEVPAGIQTFGDENYLAQMHGYRVLVTSGYRAFQEGKITMLGLADLFDEVIIDELDDLSKRRGKRAIFADLAAKNDWDPSKVWVVGDNPHSELAAGKDLGMVTVQILRPTIKQAPGFDHYVGSLVELLPLINKRPHE